MGQAEPDTPDSVDLRRRPRYRDDVEARRAEVLVAKVDVETRAMRAGIVEGAVVVERDVRR